MGSYTFKVPKGQSMPFQTLLAADDENFFKTVPPSWEKGTGFKHVPNTVVCTVSETRKVPEPTDEPAKKLAPGEHGLAAAARDSAHTSILDL